MFIANERKALRERIMIGEITYHNNDFAFKLVEQIIKKRKYTETD